MLKILLLLAVLAVVAVLVARSRRRAGSATGLSDRDAHPRRAPRLDRDRPAGRRNSGD